ncbi:hypothetical protein TK11N_24800 [Tetragenococcus koreensis]|uniref:Uncharacterized protein n=1 Tax=Tetragenococcus koreensis TaxID=290335 RepID=A0AAN4UDU2_9ENTE|nr:hypothetical protein TK11N_24800 [Tetragenococcus koreensis]GEQ53135.1 hypothetical protein TK12N_24790 [Tetragenococcus koreensis]GEQ55638.1 hypothetical protein TK2N_24820 [Tetragenococcus koreensis]GEQ58135.1 hypothetical protein TK4N_24780 [Tetragenococcus koreensis]GEQ60640.1 hypothetical protein TK6N_24790 [Tetragenococcus koreensis]
MYPLNKSQANHYFTISVVLSKGHHHFGYAKLELLIIGIVLTQAIVFFLKKRVSNVY